MADPRPSLQRPVIGDDRWEGHSLLPVEALSAPCLGLLPPSGWHQSRCCPSPPPGVGSRARGWGERRSRFAIPDAPLRLRHARCEGQGPPHPRRASRTDSHAFSFGASEPPRLSSAGCARPLRSSCSLSVLNLGTNTPAINLPHSARRSVGSRERDAQRHVG